MHRFIRTATLPSARPPPLLQSRRRCSTPIVALFTGIVQGMAQVQTITDKPECRTLTLQLPQGKAHQVSIGASVAINGTCLTVVDILPNDTLRFDVIGETLRRTNLGQLTTGSVANFERSARVGDEIGGHNVSGHVSTTATIDLISIDNNNWRMQFKVANAREYIKYILPKGFVAVDGCSLTVGEVSDDTFSVYLIPETLRVTVLGQKKEGGSVNIEIDSQTQAIVDTVERVMDRYVREGGIKR